MENQHRLTASPKSFDYFRVHARCAECGRSEDQHTIRTWWSAPNRTTGWDAPSTSGSVLAIGAALPRLSRLPTDYRGESRCGACGTTLRWAIRSARGRVMAIRPVDRAA
ncbi:MAG: hypothetical protein U0610_14620 [bacterium]